MIYSDVQLKERDEQRSIVLGYQASDYQTPQNYPSYKPPYASSVMSEDDARTPQPVLGLTEQVVAAPTYKSETPLEEGRPLGRNRSMVCIIIFLLNV